MAACIKPHLTSGTAIVWVLLSLTALSDDCNAVPRLISYQGRLTDVSGAPAVDGPHSFRFTLFADSTGGAPLWSESTDLSTVQGLFSHLLGSVIPLPRTLDESTSDLFLEVRADGETTLPRTRLVSVPFSLTAGNLDARDSSGLSAIKTFPQEHKMTIFDSTGAEAVVFRAVTGDSSVSLPPSAINAREMFNEPGLTSTFDFAQVTLNTGQMTDLVTIDIVTPEDGYIVLHGKCYALLSGTTGPNTAQIQIDEEEGGDALFPYYTMVGLAGYVNTAVNYFPIYVTRVYYREAGEYTFRMEGRANHPPPATAKSWDHILTAVYYPTSYWSVGSLSREPVDHPAAVPVIIDDTLNPERNGVYYRFDLRNLERKRDNSEDQARQR
jgi:hypothetical protein